jgi:hypothetical protein
MRCSIEQMRHCIHISFDFSSKNYSFTVTPGPRTMGPVRC